MVLGIVLKSGTFTNLLLCATQVTVIQLNSSTVKMVRWFFTLIFLYGKSNN